MITKNFSEEFLQPVAKLLRLNFDDHTMPDFLLKEKTFDDPDYNPALTLVAFDDEEKNVIGFVQGVIRNVKDKKIGYIKLLCVDSNERRNGLGTELYNQIEEIFIENNINKIRICESFPNYLFPGIDSEYIEAQKFFTKLGFKKFNETKNLYLDLFKQNYETFHKELELNEFGYFVKRATLLDKEKLKTFVSEYFPKWNYEVKLAFDNDPITLFFAEYEGRIVGFAASEVNNIGTGTFGPIGIIDEFKNHGIGGLLLVKGIKDLKDMGYVKATIPWVSDTGFFYRYINIGSEKFFYRYEKLLNKDIE